MYSKLNYFLSWQNENVHNVSRWRWCVFLTKDRNGGKQWLVQRGSVTCHANDKSAAGSAGSPPHCYTLVCSRSKAAPTHCDTLALTDWQRNTFLHCVEWLVREGVPNWTVADIRRTDARLNTNPQPLWINQEHPGGKKRMYTLCSYS